MENFPEWLVFHIPHDSELIPKSIRNQFCLTDLELKAELVRMTDHHTRDLFLGDTRASNVVCASVSRLVVDVERFEKDADEPMATMGMGVIYTLTSDQKPLRRPISEQERQTLLGLYYRPHHEELNRVVRNVLALHGHCLVVDCHSFLSVPLACDLDKRVPRPDICIGTDTFHTSAELAERFVRVFEKAGFEVALDSPFSGVLVPTEFYRRDQRVSAIMVEVNRRLYCDESIGGRLDNFSVIADKISACCLSAIGGHFER